MGREAGGARRRSSAVGRDLLRYGRELDRRRAAQLDGSFSGRPEADALLRSDPNAFLIGVLFTQGIPAERAWAAPYELKRRLGHLDVGRLAASEVAEVERALAAPPALHRFRSTLPRYIVGTARMLASRYSSDASRVWSGRPTALELRERLLAFPGVGHKKAAMATELLIRTFGVPVREHAGAAVAYDVHVRRVMLRTGLVARDDRHEVELAAREVSPERPSLIDLPLWLVGRSWCRPARPACDACRLASVCPKLIGRAADGVGVH